MRPARHWGFGKRDEAVDAEYLHWPTRARAVGDDGESGCWSDLVVGGDQKVHANRGEELHFGEVNNQCGWLCAHGGTDCAIELWHGEYVQISGDGDDEYPAS